jgi:hypothetical protein
MSTESKFKVGDSVYIMVGADPRKRVSVVEVKVFKNSTRITTKDGQTWDGTHGERWRHGDTYYNGPSIEHVTPELQARMRRNTGRAHTKWLADNFDKLPENIQDQVGDFARMVREGWGG